MPVCLELKFQRRLTERDDPAQQGRALARVLATTKALKPTPRAELAAIRVEDGIAHLTVKCMRDKFSDLGVLRRQFEEFAVKAQQVAKGLLWELHETWVVAHPGKPEEERQHVEFDALERPGGDGTVRTPTIVELPPLDDAVIKKYFGKLYGWEPRIRRVYDAMRRAAETGFEVRNHVLLYSRDPGCGKTEFLLGLIEWLGEANVWAIDGGTMSKAGLEVELLRRAKDQVLAPFIVAEEVEKAPEANYNCLLQVMDRRGKIQRTNARGDQWAYCRPLVLMTCNDDLKLRDYLGGALWSRSAGSRVNCTRPTREDMHKILVDKCGREDWVNAVTAFMYDELASAKGFERDYDDPRLGTGLLAGGDRLLDPSPSGALADFRATEFVPQKPRTEKQSELLTQLRALLKEKADV